MRLGGEPDEWDLASWHEGSAGSEFGKAKKKFPIESKSLIELRDWLAQKLELLGKELESLAASHGLH